MKAGRGKNISELLFVIDTELKLLRIRLHKAVSTSHVTLQSKLGRKFCWTGKITDLVELIYGLAEMSCINEGKVSIKELSAFFYDLFGVDGKDAYRLYADIKERKSDSRTYFLDQMAKSLNERIYKDEELQAKRR